MPRRDLAQLRRDTAAHLASVNPILADGEPVVERDTGQQKNGNGVTAWNSLPYVGSAPGDMTALEAELANQQDEIDALTTTVAGKANTSHTQAISTITGLQNALDTKAATAHSQAINTVTGLQTALDATNSDITDIQTELTGAVGTGDLVRESLVQIVSIPLITDYGMVGDGATDNTSAFQTLLNNICAAGAVGVNKLFAPPGEYIFSTEPSGAANAQVTIPIVSVLDQAVVIELIGPYRPSANVYAGSAIPSPDLHAIFRSTATGSGTLPALIGGVSGPAPSDLWNNVMLNISSMVFHLPVNPNITALDLSKEGGVPLIQDVCVHAGIMNAGGTLEPTNVQYGLRLAENGRSAYQRVERYHAHGMFYGIQIGELTTGSVIGFGCRTAVSFAGAYHGVALEFVGAYECKYALEGNGGQGFTIALLDIEEMAAGSWRDGGYDINDPVNYLYGEIGWIKFSLYTPSHELTKLGGAHLVCKGLAGTGTLILPDANPIVTNATRGSDFLVPMAGDRTLSNPTNPHAGQSITWKFVQGAGGNHILTLDTAFQLGSTISSVVLSTAESAADFLTARYDYTSAKWCVTDFKKGY